MTPELQETTPPSRDRAKHLLAAIVAAGIACRLVQYLWRRSYWHDESYLVLNIVGGHVRDAFGPLKLLQAAPPLFLIIEIYATRLLGTTEYALRLVPLVLACASVVMMAVLSQRLAGRFVACLATLMFATSDQLIWHASECKQYSGDVFVALLLLLLATGRDDRRRFLAIAALSSVLVWLSHPTMFVFGGVSLVALLPSLRTRRGTMLYLGANALFAASVIALYLVSIRPQQYPEMYAYWQHDFVPWARPRMIPFWFVRKLFSLANYAYENAGPIVLFAAIVGAMTWWRSGLRRPLLLFVLPLGLNVLASALHRFPFSGTRVTLYATPMLFLLCAVGVERIVQSAAPRRWARATWALPIALAAIGILPATYAFVVPRHRGHVRPSAEFIAARRRGDEPIYVIGIVEPWRCYLTDRSIRWRSIKIGDASHLAGASFWLVYSSASVDDAKRQSKAVTLATRSATLTDRIDVTGSTAVRFERPSLLGERELAPRGVGVDPHVVAVGIAAFEDAFGDRVLEPLLDHALQRPRAERRVVPLVGQLLQRGRADVEREVSLGEALAEPAHLHVDDPLDLPLAQRVEDDRLVDAVEELGPEERLEHVLDGGLDLPIFRARRPEFLRGLAAEVARHHDDRILEVDRAALPVGQPAVVEHLQQHVEHVAVRLLDLVEEDDAVRLATHGLGQPAALLVADVAGRRADQSGDAVLFHELAHVDADDRVLVVEQELGERLAQLGLSDARSGRGTGTSRSAGSGRRGPRGCGGRRR